MSVKISQLPEFSGSPAATWIVLNNSGETTTSKILREDFLTGIGGGVVIAGDGTNSIINDYYATTANAGEQSVLLGGIDNTIVSGNQEVLLGGRANSIQATSTGASGHTIIGSYSSYINHTGQWQGHSGIYSSSDSYIEGNTWSGVLVGGLQNYIQQAPLASIYGGQSNRIIGAAGTFNSGRHVIVGGYDNFLQETGSAYENSGIFAGYSSYIRDARRSVLVGGESSYIENGGPNGIFQSSNTSVTNSNYNSSAIGTTASVITSAAHGVIAGGYGNTLKEGNAMFVSGRGNIMWGSYNDCDGGIYSSWNSTSFTAGKATMMGAGYTNYLANGSHYSVLLGGEQNTLNSAESSFMAGNDYCVVDTVDKRVAMLASSGSTISGGTAGLNESAMIGSYNTKYHASGTQPASIVFLGLRDRNIILGNADRPFNPSGTTFVENHHVYRTLSRQTLTGITATGSVQVNLGNQTMMSFTITGNITDITFTNWREGGMYEFYVYNSGSYTITASGVRLDGIANTIYAKGGTLNPTNNGYTYYRMTIIDSKGWLDEHLNFSAL